MTKLRCQLIMLRDSLGCSTLVVFVWDFVAAAAVVSLQNPTRSSHSCRFHNGAEQIEIRHTPAALTRNDARTGRTCGPWAGHKSRPLNGLRSLWAPALAAFFFAAFLALLYWLLLLFRRRSLHARPVLYMLREINKRTSGLLNGNNGKEMREVLATREGHHITLAPSVARKPLDGDGSTWWQIGNEHRIFK